LPLPLRFRAVKPLCRYRFVFTQLKPLCCCRFAFSQLNSFAAVASLSRSYNPFAAIALKAFMALSGSSNTSEPSRRENQPYVLVMIHIIAIFHNN
jgi:hypothetical protein